MNDSTTPVKVKVFVVDDEEDVRLLVSMLVEGLGYETIVAGSAEEALALLADHSPDVIVSDVNMGGMDGFGFLAELRSRPAFRATPFMFLTALAENTDRLKGLRLGCDDYLTKPFEPEELELRVEAAVRRAVAMRSSLAQETSKDVEFSGDLTALGPGAILAMLEFEQKSGLLFLESGNGGGRLWVKGGRIMDGKCTRAGQDVEGLAAVHGLLGLRDGQFRFQASAESVEDKIGQSTMHLLMDAARLADEESA